MAREIGAFKVIFSSSRTRENLQEAFDEATRLGLETPPWYKAGAPPDKPPKPDEFEKTRKIDPGQIAAQLPAKFGTYLLSPKFSDISIECRSDGTIFPAHKIILVCGSDLFYNLLVKGQLSPAFDEFIQNPDRLVLNKTLSSQEVKQWLHCIYSRVPDNTSFTTKYSEDISSLMTFRARIQELALCPKPRFVDVSFDPSDSVQVQGHRILLNANCGLFEGLFDSQDQSFTFDAVPTTICSDDLELLKSYLYGADILLTENNVCGIMQLANKHLVEGLEQVCELFIRKHFSQFDPFDIFVFAKKWNCHSLVEFCVWFFRTNYVKFEGSTKWGLIPEVTRKFIVSNQWPGPEYVRDYAEWEKRVDQIMKDHPDREHHKEHCILQ